MSMKRLLSTLSLALPLLVSGMSRQEAEALVADANTAYTGGHYTEALALYDSARTEYGSASLLYNIGNCHFKLNDIPRAILFYERALRLSPGADDIQGNLDLARQQVVDRVHALPSFSLGNTWSSFRGGRYVDQWARRALWGGTLLFALLAMALLVRTTALRRTLQVAAAIALLFTLTATGFAAARKAEVTSDGEAIVLQAKVDVRSEPREGATVLFVLHKGTKVEVLQGENGWNEVRLPNGNVGWMPAPAMETI